MPRLLVGKLTHVVLHRRAKMVNNCCVVGCINYVGKANGLRLYRFPMADRGATKSGTVVRRDHWEPKAHTRICGEHFETG